MNKLLTSGCSVREYPGYKRFKLEIISTFILPQKAINVSRNNDLIQ